VSVARRYTAAISVAELAEDAGVHPTYAAKIFKASFGMPLWEYVTHLRVAHAVRLLTGSDWSIDRIAYESGFHSRSSFYRAFGRLTGDAPSLLRRRERLRTPHRALVSDRRMRSELTSLLCDLVAIDSVNPSLAPGGAGEAEIAQYVARWAADRGLEATTLEATPGRPTVLVRAPGGGGGRTLLLCGHLDTVTVEGMADPHVPRIDGDRLHGRGAYDMKAGLAAALVAAHEAQGAAWPVTSSSPPSPTRSTRASACRRRSPRSAPTRRSSPSPPSSRWRSPTRASCGARSRSPAVPRTGRDRTWASTRSPRRGRC
jgi:AraC-like DNA-binding protein